MRTIASVVCTALALLAGPTLTSPAAGSDAVGRSDRQAAVDLRVGSFNVRNVSLDGGGAPPWRDRRTAVIATILGQDVDVLGVQEVNPSRAFASRLVDGPNQFLDLRNGLNRAGGSFALTSPYAFNCRRPRTDHRCRRVDRGATHSDRILYDTEALELVDRGKLKYDAQVRGTSPGYLAWAVLRSRVNGAEMLFSTTHLEPKNDRVRGRQWREMVREVNRVKDGRPVVATGDFNTHKFAPLARRWLPRMKQAGYGDVLNQQYRTSLIAHPRAASTHNAWMNTANKFQRDVRAFGYWEEQHRVGNAIDWIWADNDLPVREYAVAVDWDPATWQVNGVIPSDHNMVRATLSLG